MIFPYTSRGVLYAAKVRTGCSGVSHSPAAACSPASLLPHAAAVKAATASSAPKYRFLPKFNSFSFRSPGAVRRFRPTRSPADRSIEMRVVVLLAGFGGPLQPDLGRGLDPDDLAVVDLDEDRP